MLRAIVLKTSALKLYEVLGRNSCGRLLEIFSVIPNQNSAKFPLTIISSHGC
jgi:hypothetical protein